MNTLTNQQLNEMAARVDEFCPEDLQFMVLVFPRDPSAEKILHATNAHRGRAIEASYQWQLQHQSKPEKA